MRKSRQTQSIAHALAAVALRGPSPLDHMRRVVHRVLRVIRRSTNEMARGMGDLP